MKDDKITAMWEEDGDLMRLKEFFAYIHQDDHLKDRIKQKALAKITDSNTPTSCLMEQDQTQGEQDGGENEPEQDRMAEKSKVISREETGRSESTTRWKTFRNNRMAKNVMKTLSAAAVVIFAVYIGSTGLLTDSWRLGSAKSSDIVQSTEGAGARNAPAPMAPGSSPDYAAEFQEKGEAAYDSSGRNSVMESASFHEAPAKMMEQKIIYVLEVSLKSDNVTSTVKSVQEKVSAVGGYVAESRQNNNETQTTAYLTLRIPSAQFESFKGDLSAFGTVADEHLFTDDVSKEYFDVETRLRSWEAQEKRYLEILNQAKTVEEILKIEDSLANVRREMESLKGQLQYWDNRVQYSEIRMNIYPSQSNFKVNDPWQPVSLQSTFEAAKNAVIKTISFIWNAVNYLIIFVGYALPLGILLATGWFVYRKRKRR